MMQSCSKENNELITNNEEKINLKKIESVLDIKDFDDQKIAFNLLNKDEKCELWKKKLNKILSENYLNSNQKLLIKNILVDLKPSVYFQDKNDYDQYFENIVSKKFISEAELIFSSKQIKEYFFEITASRAASEVGKSCNFNNAIIGGWDCTFPEACKATGVTCTDTRINCGVFNTSPCDGIYKYTF